MSENGNSTMVHKKKEKRTKGLERYPQKSAHQSSSRDRAKARKDRKWSMDSEETLLEMADIFAVMGDRSRLHILEALRTGECTVTELEEITGLSQSAVSHQLRILRLFRLVRYEKAGRQTIYALDDDHVIQLLMIMRQHQQERK